MDDLDYAALPPAVAMARNLPDGDSVVIFNFRADRVIELSKAFEYTEFSHFDRVRCPNVKFAGIMQYDGDLKLPANYLVPPPAISGTSGEYLAKNGLKTFVCSETQKFGTDCEVARARVAGARVARARAHSLARPPTPPRRAPVTSPSSGTATAPGTLLATS